MKALLFAMILPCLVSKSTLAQSSRSAPPGRPSPQPKVQSLDFEDDLIEAEPTSPLVHAEVARSRARFGTLIHLRQDFAEKLRQSASEI